MWQVAGLKQRISISSDEKSRPDISFKERRHHRLQVPLKKPG